MVLTDVYAKGRIPTKIFDEFWHVAFLHGQFDLVELLGYKKENKMRDIFKRKF